MPYNLLGAPLVAFLTIDLCRYQATHGLKYLLVRSLGNRTGSHKSKQPSHKL